MHYLQQDIAARKVLLVIIENASQFKQNACQALVKPKNTQTPIDIAAQACGHILY